MSKLSQVFQIRLSQQEKLMLERLATPRKPMAMVLRDLIRKAYNQAKD